MENLKTAHAEVNFKAFYNSLLITEAEMLDRSLIDTKKTLLSQSTV